MPRSKDPLHQTKKDIRALRDLWRKALEKFSKMLDRDDLPASLLAEVTKFLQANACTAKDFVNLQELERMRTDKSGTYGMAGSVVKDLTSTATYDRDKLERELAEIPKEWDEPSAEYREPLKD